MNGNGNGTETKQHILQTLIDRPVGLTISYISKKIGVHRQTVAKYLLVLEAEGSVHRREVGSATIHYPQAVVDGVNSQVKRRLEGKRKGNTRTHAKAHDNTATSPQKKGEKKSETKGRPSISTSDRSKKQLSKVSKGK